MLHFAKWKIILVLAVSIGGLLFAAPNILGPNVVRYIPGWLPNKTVHLGLDLQGGSHLLLEVGVNVVVAERLQSLRDDVRRSLREARIGYTGLRVAKEAVDLTIRKPEQFDEGLKKLKSLAAPVAGGLFSDGTIRDLVFTSPGSNRISITLSQAAIDARIKAAVEQSIEIVRRRVDELGTTEPTIQRQGTDRILVQVPGLDDPARLKALLGQTAKMSFRLVDVSVSPQQAQAGAVPASSELLESVEQPPVPYVVNKRVMVSGEDLVDAQPGFDQRTNEPIVSFRFDATGAKKFGKATQANVGRPFAIVLDNKVISAPVIREPILGGSGQISGGFTVEQANDLAILLRAGALPAPLKILEERTVGPGLGADSIAAGKIASIIGLVSVVVLMMVAFGLFGLFANVALLVNIVLIMGVLSALQATLTLPGIAGIVLTIGMAVDANVLIFERIREEVAAGKTTISAIQTGYSRALTTILDANITTFIAAAILFMMGSGPVRGFAVTLAIGIVTSVFTAYTLTRLIISVWVRRRRPTSVPL